MTDATNQTALNQTDSARVFSDKEIKVLNALHERVLKAEETGSKADVTMALALNDLKKAEGWGAIINTKTGQPFESWTEYHLTVAPTKSPAAVSKFCKVASLLGDRPAETLAAAGIEKLYVGLGLVDKGLLTLDNVVERVTNMTAAALRDLAQSKGKNNDERLYPLVGFSVTAAQRDRFASAMGIFATSLKLAGNGKAASDWATLDAMTETLNTLDRDFVNETVAGIGGSAPRQNASLTENPPEEVLKWVVNKYAEEGHDTEQTLQLIQNAVNEEIQKAQYERRAREIHQKAAELDAKRDARKHEATVNKLVKMSSNIEITVNDGGTYLIVDVFKDNGNAYVKALNESKTPELPMPEEGATVPLPQLAGMIVSMKKAPAPKKVKADPAEDTGTRFSKAKQTAKSAAPKGKGKKTAPTQE